MNKQQLEQRKVELKKNFDAVVSNANAMQGAIQDCEFWLGQIAAEEAAAAKKLIDDAQKAATPETPVQA